MGLSLRDASLIILFFALLTSIPPAFMGIGGMETGLRQLIQARYSFGCVRQRLRSFLLLLLFRYLFLSVPLLSFYKLMC
jgi:purine-cytosine permease-like protein